MMARPHLLLEVDVHSKIHLARICPTKYYLGFTLYYATKFGSDSRAESNLKPIRN